MFHVVTVHWQTDAWIAPQLRFLRRHLPPGTRYYASLNGIDRDRHDDFDWADDLPGTHAEKLNALAAVVGEQADAGDHLVFVDGDAFPIAPVRPALLADAPLAAVRRDENLGDLQPHPCFCVTTVGFWQEVGGDWRPGHEWRNALGALVTDVGGNLLGILTERGIPWTPLLRTNRRNPHPLWFAVYGDLAYHHGAGFRARLGRIDGITRHLNPRVAAAGARVPERVPVIGRLERSLRYRVARRRRRRFLTTEADAMGALADEVFAALSVDDDFWRRFVDEA